MNAMHLVRLIAALAVWVIATPSYAAPPVPAKIVGSGETSDSVGYVVASGTTSIDATIGRWDTAYPYPDTGEYAPGLQPTGWSGYYIDVDVNDGGTAVFSYLMQTWDAGIYDWYDIIMRTPTESIVLVAKLGKPGTAYGTYWKSPLVSMSQPLAQWKNQRVRFFFRVQQDGWGDQTQGVLAKFKIATCSVANLEEITDPVALDFEAGNTIRVDMLTPAASAGLSCMRAEVAQHRGNLRLNSAWRAVPYQAHLRDVYDRWQLLRNNTSAACRDLKQRVNTEFTQHSLIASQRPAAGSPTAPHALGIAIDASITGLTGGETRDSVARTCGMYRPFPNDPPHYQPR